MTDYERDGRQLMLGIGKPELKIILQENINSMIEAIEKCECPRSKCQIPERMHDILKQCLLLGQPQGETRTRAISFSRDSSFPSTDENCLREEKRPKLVQQQAISEETDHAYFSGSSLESDNGDVKCSANINSDSFECHVKRGLFILFNNIWFTTKKDDTRNSAGEEGVKMIKLFEKLGFKTKLHENKSKSDMEMELIMLATSEELCNYDCLVCMCMSHGSEEGFHGSDGVPYKLDDIINRFTGENCSSAVGIPKIFLFQSCRGSKDEEGYLNARGPDVVKDSKANNSNLYKNPTESDILVSCSASHGMTSERTFNLTKKQTNSWYVSALHEVVSKYAGREDVLTMLTRVNNQVALPHDGTKYLNMPCIYSTLRKRVFLK